MSYESNDPRSALASSPPAPARANIPAQYLDFSALPPDEISPLGSRTWWARAQNVVVGHSLVRAGEHLERAGQPDEYLVLFPDASAAAEVVWTGSGSDKARVTGRSVVVVPPGDSRIEVQADTSVVRLFSPRATDLAARCRNRCAYTEPDPNVAAFAPWPDPVDGFRIRVHPIDEFPYEQGRFGRIFRCSTIMVNVFDPDYGPRDTAHLSPHHHDDFEQVSLALDGRYTHHIRTPWTPDLAAWRADEHVEVGSPSVTVIPPPAVHTSNAVGQERNQLVDVFCPPRLDFSQRPGWVLAAEEYPVPGAAS
ncbi:hypothetical protein WIS52_25565 [Pseudonocardia nematodicida]|uniref:5-deoxy-glucuronate isomerase n=1 Tax=Pseudonocardia nematodicida TaxID=1206997 RepID=A0ABV1KJ11_9PSEU